MATLSRVNVSVAQTGCAGGASCIGTCALINFSFLCFFILFFYIFVFFLCVLIFFLFCLQIKVITDARSEHCQTQMTALGLTCKEAYRVFSENETLRLQKRVKELEDCLSKYEALPLPYVGKPGNRGKGFLQAHYTAATSLERWITDNVTNCSESTYDGSGLHAVMDVNAFKKAISAYLSVFTENVKFCERTAEECLVSVVCAMNGARYGDETDGWCEWKPSVHHIITTVVFMHLHARVKFFRAPDVVTMDF